MENTPLLQRNLDENLLNGFQLDYERAATKPSYLEGGRAIGKSSVPQVRVDVVGRAMQLTITHIFVQFENNCTHNSLNCTWLCLVQLLDCYWYNYSRIAIQIIEGTYTPSTRRQNYNCDCLSENQFSSHLQFCLVNDL